jgi:hypothetical protein
VTAHRRWFALAAVAALLLAACGTLAGTAPAPTSSPDGGPSPGCGAAQLAAADRAAALELLTACTRSASLNEGQLRLAVIERLGPRWYCDPDEYPVAHGDEQQRAIERFEEMRTEQETYWAIAGMLGIDATGAVTDAQKLAIYRLWKVALSIPMDPIGGGAYRFDYLAQPVGGGAQGLRTAGIMNADGTMTIEQQAPAGSPPCPICLARGTMIDTPAGPIAVEAVRLGDPIWTRDAAGNRVAGTVIALGSTTAPADHHVIRLTLLDGRTVTASPGHPLADGRQLGALKVGDIVDGSAIASLEVLPYSGGETFDLVASGATGTYYSDGIPLGTTLLPTDS